MVYLVHCPALEATKIGVAEHPTRRLGELQQGCPARLYLIGVAPGDEMDEAGLHDHLRHLRIHGEWFRHSDEVIRAAREILPFFREIDYQEDARDWVVGASVEHPKHGDGRILDVSMGRQGKRVRVQFSLLTRSFILDKSDLRIKGAS